MRRDRMYAATAGPAQASTSNSRRAPKGTAGKLRPCRSLDGKSQRREACHWTLETIAIHAGDRRRRKTSSTATFARANNRQPRHLGRHMLPLRFIEKPSRFGQNGSDHSGF